MMDEKTFLIITYLAAGVLIVSSIVVAAVISGAWLGSYKLTKMVLKIRKGK